MIGLFNHSRIRQGGTVKRFHTWQVIGEQTVASHTWGVIAILYAICEPSAALVRKAVFHDIAEYDTGDIPSTAKWASPALKSHADDLEKDVETRLGIRFPDLSEHEQDWLKFADLCDMLWFCVEQKRLGNRHISAVWDRVITVVDDLYFDEVDLPHMREAFNMFLLVQEEWKLA